LQTRHTADRGDTGTYFVIYRCEVRHLWYKNCYTLQTRLLLRFTR